MEDTISPILKQPRKYLEDNTPFFLNTLDTLDNT